MLWELREFAELLMHQFADKNYNQSMSVEYVLFDLDDTLVRTDSYIPAFVKALMPYGFEPNFLAQHWLKHTGLSLAQQLAGLLECSLEDKRVDAASERFWDAAQEASFVVLPGADWALRMLHERDYQLFLSTGSNPERVEKVLRETGWQELFALPQGTTLDNPKGAAHYQKICQHLGLSLERFAYQAVSVGDGVYDVQYAKQHGLYAVAYTPDGTPDEQRTKLWDLGADQFLSDLRGLPDVVGNL